jgi:acetyl-CoA carboxylase carboxyl transferase subunit alpha
MEMARLKIPIVSIVVGEGGSGGALALSVADKLLMLEHAIYSVISPEGCTAILWKRNGEQITTEDFARAADSLKLTAQHLKALHIIDEIIPEPTGGAHREPEIMAKRIADCIIKSLETLQSKSIAKLLEERYKRFRRIGSFMQTVP